MWCLTEWIGQPCCRRVKQYVCSYHWIELVENEKKNLSIVYGCERFNHYVYGRKVTVERGHKPFQALAKKPTIQFRRGSSIWCYVFRNMSWTLYRNMNWTLYTREEPRRYTVSHLPEVTKSDALQEGSPRRVKKCSIGRSLGCSKRPSIQHQSCDSKGWWSQGCYGTCQARVAEAIWWNCNTGSSILHCTKWTQHTRWFAFQGDHVLVPASLHTSMLHLTSCFPRRDGRLCLQSPRIILLARDECIMWETMCQCAQSVLVLNQNSVGNPFNHMRFLIDHGPESEQSCSFSIKEIT